MSSQRGNATRTRPQKHKNQTAFKNDLHDKTVKIKMINSLTITDVCARCKDAIQWKIKYKKYKPLTVPKKCTACNEKTIRKAYYILCVKCCLERKACGKCGEKKEIVQEAGLSPSEQAAHDAALQRELEGLPERKRRIFLRLHEQGRLTKEMIASAMGSDDFDDDFSEDEGHDDSSQDEGNSEDVIKDMCARGRPSNSQEDGGDFVSSAESNQSQSSEIKENVTNMNNKLCELQISRTNGDNHDNTALADIDHVDHS